MPRKPAAKPRSKKTPAPKPAQTISARIKVLGKTYKATGSTISEAIANLKPAGTARGLSILTITTEDGSRDRIMPPAFTLRLFSQSKLMREIAIKHAALRF